MTTGFISIETLTAIKNNVKYSDPNHGNLPPVISLI